MVGSPYLDSQSGQISEAKQGWPWMVLGSETIKVI